MGVTAYDTLKTSSIPPAKMFKAFALDFDTLVPKILPQVIKSAEIVEGDGGQGSIKVITFWGGNEFETMKIRVDEVDKENFSYGFTVIESASLVGGIESFSFVIKMEVSPDGGSIFKSYGKYYTKDDVQVTEQIIEAAKAKSFVMFKAIEAYLLVNPDA